MTYWVKARYSVRLNAAQAAATLRHAGRQDEAVTALRIARREIADGDGDEFLVTGDTAPNGPDLHSLAYAISTSNAELDVAGPAGEATDWDDPESYHVWVLPGPQGPGGQQGEASRS